MSEHKPQFNFGDIVKVVGYFPQIFVIDGWREERYHYPDETWTDIVYELHGVSTLDWLEADAEDLSLVAKAADADEYVAMYRRPTLAPVINVKEDVKMTNKPKPKGVVIDGLLDDYNKYCELERVIGDGEYADKAAGVIAELKEITGEER